MKLVSVVGARPQFVKVSVVARALDEFSREHPEVQLRHLVVHTGQHYDYEMSGVFFDGLKLPEPDYYLSVGSGGHGWQTAEMLKRVEDVLVQEKPDAVIVYGDTNSTLAAALAASKLRMPVVHVEAGLRSYNRAMPEEINRVLTDCVSDLLFCPTRRAVSNLEREGILAGVYWVGDVMYDSVIAHGSSAESRSSILSVLGLEGETYVLVTVHRAENTDDPARMEAIWSTLSKIAQADMKVVLPIHPRVAKRFPGWTESSGDFVVTKPVGYLDMLMLERHASVIVTDSGGVQKEAFMHRVPCITLRHETEWPETVESGWNVLVGAEEKKILSAIHAARTRGYREAIGSYFGDGHAGRNIASLLFEHLDKRTKMETREGNACQ